MAFQLERVMRTLRHKYRRRQIQIPRGGGSGGVSDIDRTLDKLVELNFLNFIWDWTVDAVGIRLSSLLPSEF